MDFSISLTNSYPSLPRPPALLSSQVREREDSILDKTDFGAWSLDSGLHHLLFLHLFFGSNNFLALIRFSLPLSINHGEMIQAKEK